eukprot:Hpha_TRINITY_DN23607_c0_g1::TRINITY_DN23607_c0_g1_i1::g.57642::m.57642
MSGDEGTEIALYVGLGVGIAVALIAIAWGVVRCLNAQFHETPAPPPTEPHPDPTHQCENTAKARAMVSRLARVQGEGSCGHCQESPRQKAAPPDPESGAPLGGKEWVELPCKHRMHAVCAQEWFLSNLRVQRFPACPECRKEVFPSETQGAPSWGTGGT